MIKNMWKSSQDKCPTFGKKLLSLRNELESLSSLELRILRFQLDKPRPIVSPNHQRRHQHCQLVPFFGQMVFYSRRDFGEGLTLNQPCSLKVFQNFRQCFRAYSWKSFG